MPQCDARNLTIVSWIDSEGVARIADCERELGHLDPYGHRGRMKPAVTTFDGGKNSPWITWFESDRRTFRGELVMCEKEGCICPQGHRGNHAY